MKGKQILGLPTGKHQFGTAKVGEKGQIVIPKEARELFHIQPGDSLLLLADDERGIAIPPKGQFDALFAGIFGGDET